MEARSTYSELEGLHETDGLLDGAADGEVVDGDLPVYERCMSEEVFQ